MNRNSRKMIIILILFAFIVSVININNSYKNNSSSNEINVEKSKEIETKNEEPLVLEDLKSAGAESEQLHNFSFTAKIQETWTEGVWFINNTSTKPNVNTDWMIIPNTKNSTIMGYACYINQLLNSSTYEDLEPSDLTTMKLSFMNESMERVNLSEFVIHKPYNQYFKFNSTGGPIKINESNDAEFVIWNDWEEDTNINYTAYMSIYASRSFFIETRFIPTIENIQSDIITWELLYDGHSKGYYDASIRIDDLEKFTIAKVLGFDGSYWKPLDYTKDSTHIFLDDSCRKYKIELQTPNYLSIVYNDNLTWATNSNKLQLYATAKMDGNMTIRFINPNGTVIHENTTEVIKDQTIFYDYEMNLNETGGIGHLNITLINGSKIEFGVKICEILFYKQSHLEGMTSNTTAFSQFFVAMGYIDTDYHNYLAYLNFMGKIPPLTEMELLNLTMIPNATVTYELEDLKGELEYKFLGGWFGAPNITAYWNIIDLSQYQIPTGEYNITYRASRPGYQTLIFKDTIIISEKEVYIEVVSIDDYLVIEESFAITVKVYHNYPYENYLWAPVNMIFTIIKNETGEVDDVFTVFNVVQEVTLSDIMKNDTIPGFYILNITIESEYYSGFRNFTIEIRKKPLTIAIRYDEDDLEEDEEFEIQWELDGGGSKNRENMSIEVYIDGIFHTAYSLENSYGGITKLELGDGEYYITYRLISPFYIAETTIKLEIEEEEEPEPTWLEENWLWVVIGIIVVIAMAALAIFLLISRHKIKAKRALESELIALKTKTSTTEQNISLIETQISQIASIYWILVIHSEQGVTMIEIVDFKFEKVIGEEQKQLIGKGTIRDSALIGGFLTAIRNFSRETSGTSLEYQPVFNSQTDYSTVVDDEEIHRRILEGTKYFMAFVSSRGTIEISDVLSSVNSIFQDGYGEAVEKFDGAISPFRPFEEEAVNYLHNEIINLQKKLSEERLLFERFERHLKEVQEKIGIKPKKLK